MTGNRMTAAVDPQAFIRVEEVSRSFGAHGGGLEGVSLHFRKGEVVFLTGPSGAGKTTLLKLLYAEEKPTSGDILIEGRSLVRLDPASAPYLRRNIGIVFQDFKLLARRTVADNVVLPLEVQGMGRAEARVRVARILDRVGLDHAADRLPGTLSAGEQQRVAVARALVHRPSLVLADEPTGNVDEELRDVLLDLMVGLAQQDGATVIVATHDRGLVEARGYREVRLRMGRVVEDRPAIDARVEAARPMEAPQDEVVIDPRRLLRREFVDRRAEIEAALQLAHQISDDGISAIVEGAPDSSESRRGAPRVARAKTTLATDAPKRTRTPKKNARRAANDVP